MKWTDLKLGGRLAAGFGLVLVLTLLIVATAWYRLGSARAMIDASNQANELALEAKHWEGLTRVNVSRTMAIANSGGHPDVKAYFAPQIKKTSAEISEIQKRLEATAGTDDEKAMFAAIADKRQTYVTSRDAIFTLLDLEDPGAKEALTSRLMPAADRYIEAIDAYQNHQRSRAQAIDAMAGANAQSGQLWVVGLGVVILLLGVGSSVLITRSVTRPMRQVMEATQQIAAGDLTHAETLDGKDEMAQLMQSLASMRSSLSGIVGSVRQVSDSITMASGEVAAGSQDLSGRTEQAAAAIEQTASSMEQMSGTIRQTADVASTANQLATNAARVAGEGGQVVHKVMSTMDDISNSSRRIADIIGVIDGIAFQTNILALNAAVEAARAGEQGRGFAVVASEVRALAHRVAEAAKEVKALIGTSVTQVESGASLVKDAGASMTEIVAAVQRVADMIGEISTATSEQSDGIRQVNDAVNHLDQMTQQNAALVEQSTAAAHSLSDQSRKLAQAVSVFKLRG